MDLSFFSESITEICSHTLVSPGRTLKLNIIANPGAGGFKIASRWKNHFKTLNEYREKAKANPPRKIISSALSLTTGKGCGEKFARAILEETAKDSAPFYIIIIAGGDGTSLEVSSSIYNAPAHVRNDTVILRLPMGTGNDSADSTTLSGALDLLIKPAKIKFAPALRLITAPGGPAHDKGLFLAFNILSVGIDAFVTHMTNKMKGKLPGDSYKLWVDVAAMIYDRLYKIDYMDVRALDEQNRETKSFREKIMMLPMGTSGHRTYGSGQKILPNDHNVCAIKQMSVFQKLKYKTQVRKGTHTKLPDTINFTAHRIEFSVEHPILAQMDGETLLLQPNDFPAAIELTAPVIPLLTAV